MEPHWEEIYDFPGYSVSSDGRVRNDRREREMRLSLNQYGVLKVGLMQDGCRVTAQVAVLVAEAFLPEPPPNFDTVIHLNGDRTDCHVDNLMWRPRWFAMKYHRQRNTEELRISALFEEVGTGEMFESFDEAARRYGLLDTDIHNDLNGQYAFLPENQKFRYVEKWV